MSSKIDVLVVDDRPEVLFAVSLRGLKTIRIRRGKYSYMDNIVLPTLEFNSLQKLARTFSVFNNELRSFLNNNELMRDIKWKSNFFFRCSLEETNENTNC